MVEAELQEQSERIERLLADANKHGYLTLNSIKETLRTDGAGSELSVAQMEQILAHLREHGVAIYDASETKEPETKKPATRIKVGGNGDAAAGIAAISIDDQVGLYFAEIGPVPLLTHVEEVDLAKRMERGQTAHAELERNGRRPEIRATLERAVAQGCEARDQLIRANTRLVISVAKKYMGLGLPFLDLIQAGNVGLIKAADRFDYNRGTKFSTYATWWIRQAVTRCLSQQSTTIRIPVHMGDRIRALRRTAQRLEQLLERRPTPEEIAEEMGDMSAENVRWLLRVARRPISLEKPIGENGDDELGSLIEDQTSPSPSDVAEHSLLRENLSEMMGSLTPREARVLRMRFGFDGRPPMSLEEVGDKIGVTRERARQIVQKALRKLRHPRHTRRLRGYLS
jgi:RNA polymerase primary sigma factor